MDYVDIFKMVHLEVKGVPFTMINGREGKSLKELYSNVNQFWKEKNGVSLDLDKVPLAFRHFLESIEDEYILDIFTPSVILQNFQQIVNIAYGKRYAKEEKKKILLHRFSIKYTEEELEEILQIKRAYKRQSEEAKNAPQKVGNLGAKLKKELSKYEKN